MSIQFIVYMSLIFLAVFLISIAAFRRLFPSKLQINLNKLANSKEENLSAEQSWIERIAKVTGPLAKLSTPKEGWAKSSLRAQFIHAGIRAEYAPAMFLGGQILLALLLPLILWLNLALWTSTIPFFLQIFFVLIAAFLGFLLPKIILLRIIKQRQREISENLPNALDLLTICMEAGLVIDAGIARVAQEMMLTSPAFGEELHIVTLELRAGNNKEKALRNLATRTGVDSINVLVSMLIQTERFGTSIAEALRIHSEQLRIKRRQLAEEAAAKISVKLLMPLILCIFPSIFIVILGPAGIQAFGALSQSGGLGGD